MLRFQKLELNMLETYQRFYQLCDDKCSDYSFMNMWGWNDKYKFELAFDNDLCWICSRSKDGDKLLSPIGNWHQEDWLKRFEPLYDNGIKLFRIPHTLGQIISRKYPGKTETHVDRNNWEYIYRINDLIDLKGQKYRNKRKALNQFKEMYEYEFRMITAKDMPDVKNFQETWLKQAEMNDEKNLFWENKALIRTLDAWHSFSERILGGIITINGEIIAYTVAEVIDNSTIIIHFEKALYSYKGAYAAINQMFLEKNRKYQFVNREQDIGDDGLRKSKMEYRPLKFIKKEDFFCCLQH